jgi:hypothetical protein
MSTASFSVNATPYAYTFDPAKTALVLSQPISYYSRTIFTHLLSVDFQGDFILEGGFGEVQGANLKSVQDAVGPAKKLLDLSRKAGLTVIHTREGHDPSLKDCPTPKVDFARSPFLRCVLPPF